MFFLEYGNLGNEDKILRWKVGFLFSCLECPEVNSSWSLRAYEQETMGTEISDPTTPVLDEKVREVLVPL